MCASSQQHKHLTPVLIVSMDGDRKDESGNRHIICLVAQRRSENDCFNFSSINTLISSQLRARATESFLNLTISLIFIMSGHIFFSLITTNSNNISVCLLSHMQMIFKFITLLYAVAAPTPPLANIFSLSLKLSSFVIVHDV